MAGTRQEKQSVLCICTFNSVRSQMAEGLIRNMYGDRFAVVSAGIATAGVNPYAVRVMAEIGINISGHRSRNVKEFSSYSFDYVLFLCDHARRACPSQFSAGKMFHRDFLSPCEVRDNEELILRDFRELRDDIQSWLIDIFGPASHPEPEKT